MSNTLIVPERRNVWHVDAGGMTNLYPHPLKIVGWIYGTDGEHSELVITDHGVRIPGAYTFVGQNEFLSFNDASKVAFDEAEYFIDAVGETKAESSRNVGCSCGIPPISVRSLYLPKQEATS